MKQETPTQRERKTRDMTDAELKGVVGGAGAISRTTGIACLPQRITAGIRKAAASRFPPRFRRPALRGVLGTPPEITLSRLSSANAANRS